MVSPSQQPSPDSTRDRNDPGDETQRNFRYQHAYGVILLISAAAGEQNYVSIWCEHHEDFLAERDDTLFDAYQLKTATPENGPWTLTDDQLRNSIKKFVMLQQKFPNKINQFYFVSNVRFLDTITENKLRLSPCVLQRAVKDVTDESQLKQHTRTAFDALQTHCGCPATELMQVLKKLNLIVGPDRNSFEAEISNNHLPQLDVFKSCSPAELNGARDELIHKVFDASSLKSDDPSRHWSCVNAEDANDPFLKAKRILVSDILVWTKERQPVPFRYLPDRSFSLGSASKSLPILEAKMIQGGLHSQFQTMRRRALSTEVDLINLAYAKPDHIELILNQIAAIVQGECDEAHLLASQNAEPFGQKMLSDVYTRLRKFAEDRPEMVYGKEYEHLIGVAGLLTGECTVWWSHEF